MERGNEKPLKVRRLCDDGMRSGKGEKRPMLDKLVSLSYIETRLASKNIVR